MVREKDLDISTIVSKDLIDMLLQRIQDMHWLLIKVSLIEKTDKSQGNSSLSSEKKFDDGFG